MRLLVIAPRLPFPLDKGDRLTVFHLLRYFSRHHEVSCVCFLEPSQEEEWVSEFSGFCDHLEVVPLSRARAYLNCLFGLVGRTPLQIRYYAEPALRRAVDRMIQTTHPDLIYAHLIRMAQYVEATSPIPCVLAANVSMTLNYKRLAEHTRRLAMKCLYYIEHTKLRRFEPELARRFDRALFISPYDLAATKADPPLENVFFNPHGVDFEYFAPDPWTIKEKNLVVFSGNMGYAPNVDAVVYFAKEILPRIRNLVPHVRLEVVGADPAPEVQALAADSAVTVTGRVPDLRIYMNRAEVAIDPLRIGAGLQNKILEGMALELPMVVTTIANEGIQARSGEHLLIADDPAEFASSVALLLGDPALRRRLGAAAREFIVRNWSWDTHFRNLEDLFLELIDVGQHSERGSQIDAEPSLEHHQVTGVE